MRRPLRLGTTTWILRQALLSLGGGWKASRYPCIRSSDILWKTAPISAALPMKKGAPPVACDMLVSVGTLTEPEALKSAGLGSYETIGKALAKDCREAADTTWGHPLLRHNASEINRLSQHVRQILFP